MSRAPRHRSLAFAAALLALVLAGAYLRAPALDVAYLLDDYGQLAAHRGAFPVRRAPWDLYAYAHDRPGEQLALRAAGALPWWSHPHVRFAMLRPLASGLIALDDRAAPGDARAAHAHSLAWWCAAALALGWFLRRRTSAALALLAVGCFALDGASEQPVAWVANRAALISLTFGLLGLEASEGFARARTPWRALGTAGAFALCLAGGEYGLGVYAYLLALEVARRGEGVRTRALRLAPALAPLAVYAALHALGGYGTAGSAAYLDVRRQPGALLAALPERLGRLLCELYAAMPLDRWSAAAHGARFYLALGLAAFALTASLAWRASAGLPPDARRTARALVLGALPALVPHLGGALSSRLELVASVGACVACAAVLEGALRALTSGAPRASLATRALLALGALGVLGVHGALAPRDLRRALREAREGTRAVRAGVLRSPLASELRADSRVLVLAAASPEVLLYAHTMLHIESGGRVPMPRAWWVASMVPGPQVLLRTAPEVLELRAARGEMLQGPFEQLFRDASAPLRAGDEARAGGLRVQVRAMGARGPRAIALTLDESWDARDVLLALPTMQGLVRLPVPAVGRAALVPPAAIPWSSP